MVLARVFKLSVLSRGLTDFANHVAIAVIAIGKPLNDPDSAEFLSRCFGTKQIQKTTQRITNAKDLDAAEIVGEGTIRDAHQFRASPDLLKTLPTGVGAVLISHGQDTDYGGTNVFRIRFPYLRAGQ